SARHDDLTGAVTVEIGDRRRTEPGFLPAVEQGRDELRRTDDLTATLALAARRGQRRHRRRTTAGARATAAASAADVASAPARAGRSRRVARTPRKYAASACQHTHDSPACIERRH